MKTRNSFVTSNYLLMVLFVSGGMTSATFAQYKSINSVAGIRESWQEDIQLYVKGDLELSEAQLNDLAQKLKTYPNWTVVLAQFTKGEEITSDGKTYRDDVAAQFAVGVGLMNEPKFKRRVDPASALPNGSALLYYFDPADSGVKRDLFCFTSPAHEKYGLADEAVWKTEPKLFPAAKANYISGRKISEMVTEPIAWLEQEMTKREQAEVAKAENKAAMQRLTIPAAIVGMLGAIIAVFFTLVMSRRPAKSKAENHCALWNKAFSEKLASLIHLDTRKSSVLGQSRRECVFEGRTAELAIQTIDDIANLFLMHASVTQVLEKVRQLMQPCFKNLISSVNYNQALQLLSTKPIEFSKDTRLEFVINGKTVSPEELLWAKPGDFKPFSMSFDALVEAFSIRSKRAARALEQISAAVSSVKTNLDGLQGRLQKVESEFPKLKEPAAMLAAISAVHAKLVAALGADIEKGQGKWLLDPVSAVEMAAKIQARLELLETLHAQLKHVSEQEIPQLEQAVQELAGLGLALAWVEKRKQAIASGVSSSLVQLLQYETMTANCNIVADFNALLSDIKKLKELHKTSLDQATWLAEIEQSIKSAREKLAASLGTSPDIFLKEPGQDVENLLGEATKLHSVCKLALNDGELETCAKASQQVDAKLNGCDDIIERSLTANAAFDSRHSFIVAESASLSSTVPQHLEILNGLKAKFAPTALEFRSGDPTHPDSNGTVCDNIEEVEQALREQQSLLAGALEARQQGRVLEATTMLDRAKLCNAVVQSRLSEIQGKHECLEQALADTERILRELEARANSANSDLHDRKLTYARLTEHAQILAAIRGYSISAVAGQLDPLRVTTEVAGLVQRLEAWFQAVKKDRELYAEAVRSAEAARSVLANIEREAATFQQDQFQVRNVAGILGDLNAQLRSVEDQIYATGRADWETLDGIADTVYREGLSLLQSLRAQQREYSEASAALESARRSVMTTRDWVGPRGERIDGIPGSDALNRARVLLSSGRHAEAKQAARRAEQESEAARSARIQQIELAALAVSRALNTERVIRQAQRPERRSSSAHEDVARAPKPRAERDDGDEVKSGGTGGGGF